MRKIKGNIVKGWITSIIGTLLMAASLFLWFTGVIPLIWEGSVGLILGCILLLAPRTIEKKVSEYLGFRSNIQSGQNQPPVEPPVEETK